MSVKIRTKLIIAFFSIIFPFLLVMGVIAIYNLNTIYKGIHEVEIISNETQTVMSLELAMDKILMPSNDYIITGKKEYIDNFKRGSADVEGRLKEIEEILSRIENTAEVKEKRAILKDVKNAWQNINEISLKIFAISDPITNKDAARLMEEMDYKWADPAIEKLRRWQEIDHEEHRESHEKSEMAWKQAWIILISGSIILLVIGVYFTVFYTRLFVIPIEALHERADAIARGDFKGTLDIKTGDEIEQLSKAMNEMAKQLDMLYLNMGAKIEEGIKKFAAITESANDAIVCEKSPGVIFVWNKKAEEMFGYRADEVLGKSLHQLIVPQRYKENAEGGLRNFYKTGMGPVIGKTIELFGLRNDGTEFPVELSVSAIRIGEEWQAVGIIRDITERKKAEEKLKRYIDELERFHKVAVKREFRIKELQDRVKELEKK